METRSDLVSMVTNSKLSSIAGKQLLLNRPTEEYQYPMIDFYFKNFYITHWYKCMTHYSMSHTNWLRPWNSELFIKDRAGVWVW